MKFHNLLSISLVLLFSWQCNRPQSNKGHEPVAGLIENLGNLNHPVTTKSSAAQILFNQGMILIYGFNHEEAIRSFEQALKYDSNLAMAYWGIAFCYGSNYNWPADLNATKMAYENIQLAQSLSSHASEQEKDYINTLALRYTNDSTADLHALEIKYSAAMKTLSEKYPDDMDAKCLYAESMMVLHPWELYLPDGTPNEHTPAILQALEEVLARDSMHIGANHYYIHSTEMSPHPEKAMACARRLATLSPNAGHLVHMPAHVYMRTGNYEGANTANSKASKVDSNYIHTNSITGIYPMLYYTHNLHFLAVGYLFTGQFNEAKKQIHNCLKNVDPMMAVEFPMMQFMTAAPFQIYVGADDWEGIMNYPKPDSMLKITSAMWHWARALALIEKNEIRTAADEQKQFVAIVKTIPPDQGYGLGTVEAIINVTSNILSGKMSEQKKDLKSAEAFYMKAVAAEKDVHYDEPPDWFLPTNNMLGGFYLRTKNYPAAELAFRESLRQYPANAMALYGLEITLTSQQKNEEANAIHEQFETAWKNADAPLSINSL